MRGHERINMQYIYDIETFAENLNDVTVDGKYKPNPTKEKISCISLRDVFKTEIITFVGKDEINILTQFWGLIKEGDELIGFYSNAFDWQTILVRTFANNIKINLDVKKLKLTDLRDVLFPFNTFTRGKLSDFAELLGLQVNTFNGSYMREYYLKEEWNKIKAHCDEDILITYSLWSRLKSLNLL